MFRKFGFEITKQINSFYNECRSAENSLQQQKNSIVENITKKKGYYIKQVNDYLWPNLVAKSEEIKGFI